MSNQESERLAGDRWIIIDSAQGKKCPKNMRSQSLSLSAESCMGLDGPATEASLESA